MTIVSGFADVNGAQLYYEMAGTGHPLVLLHGGLLDCRMWDDQFDLFAKRYQVIRYDARGYGRSSLPDAPYKHAEDLHGLLQALGIERAALCGLSLGGMIAVDFALEHPGIVSALIPVAAVPSGFQPTGGEAIVQRSREMRDAVLGGDREQAIDIFMELWVDGPFAPAAPDVRQRARAIMADHSFANFVPSAAPPRWADPPAVERLAEIRSPTLIIVGDRDQPPLVRGVDTLAAGIVGAQKLVISGAAHMVNMEQPEAFNRAVLSFLAGM
jgi:pimeloyl-ACP methyl ester carboxylesterase